MKIFDIQNNLAPINFILAKKAGAFDELRIESDDVCHFFFPESKRHEDDRVKWLATTFKYYKISKVVIYTFDDSFINTVGAWISLGKVPADYAKIFILEGDSVQVSTYTKDGTLNNWPFGWFMADLETVENADLGEIK